jgi:hypothetical protein
MSGVLAIAAVTETLRQLLLRVRNPQPGDPPPDQELVGAEVSALPPQRARGDEGSPQLNLFLYHVTHNAQLRNADFPLKTRGGEVAPPGLALDLHYLLTAYGTSDDVIAHRLLGWAMCLLNDRAVLLPGDLKQSFPASDLYLQPELVRVTPHPVTTEEMSRLWTIFQAPYRPSVAYQVSVVLIDSMRPVRAALPALSRGVGATPSTEPPTPVIQNVEFALHQPSARLGESIVLEGLHLSGSAPTAFLELALLEAPKALAAAVDVGGKKATIQIPNDAAAQLQWPAGTYSVSLSPTATGSEKTAPVFVAIAPRITAITPANLVGGKAKLDAQGALKLTLTVSPQVWPEQRVTLLLGSRSVDAGKRNDKTDSLTFEVPKAPLGRQFVRLRVDGVDSLIVDYSAAVPVFDVAQSVEVVP